MAMYRKTISKLRRRQLELTGLLAVAKPGRVRCLVCNEFFKSVDVRTNRVCGKATCQNRLPNKA